MKLSKIFVAFLTLLISLTAYTQQKTWVGTGSLMYPATATNTFVLDKSGANTLTVNKETANNPGDTLLRLQHQGTNVFTFYPDGGAFIGGGTAAWWGSDPDGFIAQYSNGADSIGLNQGIGFYNDFDAYRYAEIFSSATWSQVNVGWDSNKVRLSSDATGSKVSINSGKTLLEPTIADGSTPYVLDTSLTHTTGSLLDVKNNGTNVFRFHSDGGAAIGYGAEEWWGGDPDGAIYSYSDGVGLHGNNPGFSGNYYDGVDVSGNSAFAGQYSAFTQLYFNGKTLNLQVTENSSYIEMNDGSRYVFQAAPRTGSGSTPYTLGSSVTHTSGNLLTLDNNTTNKFTVDFAGNTTISGNIIQPVAKTYSVASGTDQRAGNATLVGGTITVTNSTVTTNTLVMYARKTIGGTVGNMSYTISAGNSFTINSSSGTDTSTVSYFLIENP